MLLKQADEIQDYVPGLRAYTTPKGIRVLELDWWADPTHTDAWAQKNRRLYASQKHWRREMERDWSTPSGDPFFPEFGTIGEARFIHMMSSLIKGAVFRSFDFGRRRPACTWFQYSPKSDRIWLVREFMPKDLLAHPFRDAVRHLSGELDWSKTSDEAKRWVDAYAAKPSGAHCPPPWFPLGTRFIDISGKEALQGQANASKPEEAVVADIFAAAEMHLVIVNPDVAGRNQLVGRFLQLREDGWPGLFIDPQCEEMIEGFNGGFCYPMPTRANPVPNKPKNDGHYINLLDAFGYGVCAVTPKDTPKPEARPRLVGFRGRVPYYKVDNAEEIGWKETKFGR